MSSSLHYTEHTSLLYGQLQISIKYIKEIVIFDIRISTKNAILNKLKLKKIITHVKKR